MDTASKWEIIKAVNHNKTDDPLISYASDLYYLMQVGVSVDIDALDNMTAQVLMYLAEEIDKKQRREAKIK